MTVPLALRALMAGPYPIVTALGIAIGSAEAPTDQGFYKTHAVGFSSQQNWDAEIEPIDLDIDPSNAFSGEIANGRSLNKWRVQASYSLGFSSWESVKATTSGSEVEAKIKGGMTVQTFLISSFYDFKNKSKFTPYLGGGLGLSQLNSPEVTVVLDGSSETTAINSLAPSGKLIAGTSYELTQTKDIFIEGGLLQIFPLTPFNNEVSIDPLRFAGVQIGMRWKF